MTVRVTNGSLRGAYACEKRNLATVNTGFHWTVHGASQVLPLYQAPDKIARLSPPDVSAVTRPPAITHPQLEVGSRLSCPQVLPSIFNSSWLEIPGNVIYIKSQSNHSARNPSS